MQRPRRPPTPSLLAAVALALSVIPGEVAPQTTIRVSGEPCRGCRVERQLLFAISDRQQEMVKWLTTQVARDSRGRWLLTTMERAVGIAVYDASGQLLARFGRRGQGPGEHTSLRAPTIGPGDTLHLFDVALRRHSVFSPSYEFVRSSTLPGEVFGGVALPDGWLILNADFPTPERVGYPLHLVDPGGAVRGSFGSDVPGYRVDATGMLTRHLTWAGGDLVWSVPGLRFEPELWSPRGKEAVIQRVPNWFPPVRTTRPPGLNQPPTPWIAGAWADDQHRLWVLFRVPQTGWKPQPGAPNRHSGRIRPVIRWNEEFDSVLEVLDLRAGRVVASTRFDQVFGQLLPGGYASSYREDHDGNLLLEVWRLTVISP